MKLKNIIFQLLLLAGLIGCDDDFLDIVPKGQLIPQTTDDYRKVLDFVSNKNSVGQKSAILVTYGVVNLLADDYQVSDSSEYKAMITTDRYLWYEWGKEGGYGPDLDDPDWRTAYGQIYIANSAILGIPDATGPQSEKDELLAEAKFHRAFCYLGLVNIYAKHYTSASAGSDLGVPLRLGVELTESLQRATVQQVYDQVIKDLEEAVPHLEADQDIYNHRPTTAAAYGLLARTALYMGNYEDAFDYADKSLAVKDFLYDLNVILDRDPESSRFNYFPSTHRSWDDEEILIQKETTYNSSMYHYNNGARAWAPTVNALYDTANDLRFRNYFEATTSEDGYIFRGSIRRWQDAYYYLQVGLTTPEMYLTRAEANVRLGNKDEAIDDLNTLRSMRFTTEGYVPYNAGDYTQEEVLQLVKDERRRELWARGVRWFDLKRYNALDNANITIERFFTNEELAPGDPHWVVPIAPIYISQNPEIEPNPS